MNDQCCQEKNGFLHQLVVALYFSELLDLRSLPCLEPPPRTIAADFAPAQRSPFAAIRDTSKEKVAHLSKAHNLVAAVTDFCASSPEQATHGAQAIEAFFARFGLNS